MGDIKPMKALTLWRPWAWALFHGKDVENRTWAPPASMIGQRIAIHAGKKYDDAGELFIANRLDLVALPGPAHATGIIGVVTIDRLVLRAPRLGEPFGWFAGPVGWMLRDCIEFPEPIPIGGAQGLWTIPREVEIFIRGALTTLKTGEE